MEIDYSKLDYQTFAKEYKQPYRDEKDKNKRIALLEERLFSNTWALIEVRATRDILSKLLEAKEIELNELKSSL